MSGRFTSRARQRGVALITAVLIVALATVLAVNVGFGGYLDQRRTAAAFSMDQGMEVAFGGEAWAADALRRDGQQSSKVDDFTEAWATPIPPIPIENGAGEFEGVLEDMQGRFNLNSLVTFQNGRYVRDEDAVKRLTRILELIGLETKWAGFITDWIDSDDQAEFPDGAEDQVYTNLTPPYRTASMPITRTSELLALEGFGIERFQKLEPFVAALPIGTPVNLCTAVPVYLDAIISVAKDQPQEQYSSDLEGTAELRKQRCYPNKKEFEAGLAADEKQTLEDARLVGEASSNFRATIWVTLGTTQYTLYSLLYRANGTNLVRPILRSHGTP
jgi:general secretion pathway protein K